MKYFITLLFLVTISLTSNAQIKGECISGDCVNGFGLLKYTNGEKYAGYFKNGKREGVGELDSANGKMIHSGRWKDDNYLVIKAECVSGDCMNGYGTYNDALGSVYVGNFKDGKYQGKGILTQYDGKKFTGWWKDGEWFEKGCLSGNCKDGYGTSIDEHGNIETGEFKYGIMADGEIIWAAEPNGYYKKCKFKDYKFKDYKYFTSANVEISKKEFVNKTYIPEVYSNIPEVYPAITPKPKAEKEWEQDGYKIIYTDGKYYGNFTGKVRIYKSLTYFTSMDWGQFQTATIKSNVVILDYEGDLVNGIKEGFGKEDEKVTTKEGIVYHVFYVGEFKNGLRNGKGQMQSRRKVYDIGIYQDGVFIGR
jgi:hypothetical protein